MCGHLAWRNAGEGLGDDHHAHDHQIDGDVWLQHLAIDRGKNVGPHDRADHGRNEQPAKQHPVHIAKGMMGDARGARGEALRRMDGGTDHLWRHAKNGEQ